MKFLKNFISIPLFTFITGFLLFQACEPTDISSTGEVNVKITDAPSDDASIQGVFVTVAEVKVDGESYSGFQGKQTIDISAYQNGQTKALGLAELETGTYSNITLVLDTETDANGNAPGCYVLMANNEKENLAASGQSIIEITSNAAFEVTENTTSDIVIDMDLRKCIQYEDQNSAEPTFSFVSQSELDASVRVVNEEDAGTVSGSFETTLFSDPDKVVVYAYKKGTFNKETETQAQGSGNIQFKNAVTSVVAVKGSGEYSYQLSFLEEGDYEVCLVAYDDSDGDGEYTFEGFLNASIFLGGSVTTDLSVSAGLSTSLALSIIGIIG